MGCLLADARAGLFDILCAEGLDRISRDQEDMAHVHKLLRFNGIALHTVAEGLTDEMHIGFKGTMNALFLKDLADKTRRGLRGRIEKGRSGGGLAYGYDVAPGPDESAGGRSVNEDQAIVVRRIFRAFIEGKTPGAIAQLLNREAVPGPAGRPWGATTIRGHKVRGTGILNNDLYRGMLVWNRQHFVKDPLTGKRQARMNPKADWVQKEVPALRIVDESLWQAVKARQSAQEAVHANLCDAVRKVRDMRRLEPTVMSSNFYRLLICAVCGEDFCPLGRDRYGCAGHYRRKICGNGKSLQRRVMEMGIRKCLGEAALWTSKPMKSSCGEEPEVQKLRGRIASARRQLATVDARLGRLLAAIEDGLYSTRMKIRFQQLEDQATRCRAALQIDSEHLKSLQDQSADDDSGKAVAALVAELRATDDEYAILKLRRMLGPIRMTPGPPRAQSILEWDQEPRQNRRTISAPHRSENVEMAWIMR